MTVRRTDVEHCKHSPDVVAKAVRSILSSSPPHFDLEELRNREFTVSFGRSFVSDEHVCRSAPDAFSHPTAPPAAASSPTCASIAFSFLQQNRKPLIA